MRTIKHHRIPRSLVFWEDGETEVLSPKEHAKRHGRIYKMLREMGFTFWVDIYVDDNLRLRIPTFPPNEDFPAKRSHGYLQQEKLGKPYEIVQLKGGPPFTKVKFLPVYYVSNAAIINLR